MLIMSTVSISALAEGSIPVVITDSMFRAATGWVGTSTCGVDTTIDGVGRKCAEQYNGFSRGYGWGESYSYTGYTLVGYPIHGGTATLYAAELLFTKSKSGSVWYNQHLTTIYLNPFCPSNSRFDGGVQCNCNSGFVPDSTQTMCTNETYKNTLVGSTTTEPGKDLSLTVTVINKNDNQPPKNPVPVKISLKVDPRAAVTTMATTPGPEAT